VKSKKILKERNPDFVGRGFKFKGVDKVFRKQSLTLACPVKFFGEKERSEFNWGILEFSFFLFIFFRRLEFKFKK
jgi:hypothetical protein